jgi:histidine triad (HIT) family protein
MMAELPLRKCSFLSLALRGARWCPAKPIVTRFYPLLFRFLPLDRVCENANWTAFNHPQPEYPLHILILPKRGISSLVNAPSDEPQMYADLIQLVQVLINDFSLADQAYRLITNGGRHQTVPVWHWHLVCEESYKHNDDPGVNHA